MTQRATDELYRERFLEPIRICAQYKPKFGVGGRKDETEFTITDFERLFGADPLYSWVGLNSPLMYAAHKAAGGMTSIYRQLGIGCERLFRSIVQSQLELSDEEVRWGFEVTEGSGPDAKTKRLTLDARISLEHLNDAAAKARMEKWLVRAAQSVGLKSKKTVGAVFEVRQGYKSADSKRQQADLLFGIRASNEAYLPVFLVFSNQISLLAQRYRNANLLVLTGTLDKDDCSSTFAFCDSVLNYSLTSFFERNTTLIKQEITQILKTLLSP
jgi:hypothetical protein